MSTRGAEDLRRMRESAALRPTRDTLREAFPQHYREGVNRKTGKKEWRFSIPLRDRDGNRTRDGKRLQEMMEPHAASEARRARTIPQGEKEALRTDRGDIVYAPAERAGEIADANGFTAPGRISGVLATTVHGDFCPRCDQRSCWCECWQRREHA